MWFLGAPCPSARGLGVSAVDGTDLLPLGSGEDGDPGPAGGCQCGGSVGARCYRSRRKWNHEPLLLPIPAPLTFAIPLRML